MVRLLEVDFGVVVDRVAVLAGVGWAGLATPAAAAVVAVGDDQQLATD